MNKTIKPFSTCMLVPLRSRAVLFINLRTIYTLQRSFYMEALKKEIINGVHHVVSHPSRRSSCPQCQDSGNAARAGTPRGYRLLRRARGQGRGTVAKPGPEEPSPARPVGRARRGASEAECRWGKCRWSCCSIYWESKQNWTFSKVSLSAHD